MNKIKALLAIALLLATSFVAMGSVTQPAQALVCDDKVMSTNDIWAGEYWTTQYVTEFKLKTFYRECNGTYSHWFELKRSEYIVNQLDATGCGGQWKKFHFNAGPIDGTDPPATSWLCQNGATQYKFTYYFDGQVVLDSSNDKCHGLTWKIERDFLGDFGGSAPAVCLT